MVRDADFTIRFPRLPELTFDLLWLLRDDLPLDAPAMLGLHNAVDLLNILFDGTPRPDGLMGCMEFATPHAQPDSPRASLGPVRYDRDGGSNNVRSKYPEPCGRAVRGAIATFRRIATSGFPPELDRRCLDLGERKESLTPSERDELFAWVTFTQERSAAKLEAEVALRQLTELFPDIG